VLYFCVCVVNTMEYLALQKMQFFYRHVCVKVVYQLHCCISVQSTIYLHEKFKEFNLSFCGAVAQRGSQPLLL
jgi:hypothetical protein